MSTSYNDIFHSHQADAAPSKLRTMNSSNCMDAMRIDDLLPVTILNLDKSILEFDPSTMQLPALDDQAGDARVPHSPVPTLVHADAGTPVPSPSPPSIDVVFHHADVSQPLVKPVAVSAPAAKPASVARPVSKKRKRKSAPCRALPASKTDDAFSGISFTFPEASADSVRIVRREYFSPSKSFLSLLQPEPLLKVSRRAGSTAGVVPSVSAATSEMDTASEISDDDDEPYVPSRSVEKRPAKRRIVTKSPASIPPKPNLAASRKQKTCACCGVTSTPLWRDFQNVALCNACGIRFKKYKIICEHCQYVPCKQQRDSKMCCRCGEHF